MSHILKLVGDENDSAAMEDTCKDRLWTELPCGKHPVVYVLSVRRERLTYATRGV